MSDWNEPDQNQRKWYPNTYNWPNESAGSYNASSENRYPIQQYVGFNEFFSQLQQNAQMEAAGYSNSLYPQTYNGHPQSQVNSQSNSQYYEYSPNISNAYNQCNGSVNDNLMHTNGYFSSNLTPTATEFVPKYQYNQQIFPTQFDNQEPSTSKQAIYVSTLEQRDNTNVENGASSSKVNTAKNKNETKNKQKSAPKTLTTEDVGRTFYNSNVKAGPSQDVRHKKQDNSKYDNHLRVNNNKDVKDNKDKYGNNSYKKEYNKETANRDIQNVDSSSRERDFNSKSNHNSEVGRNNRERNGHSRENNGYNKDGARGNREHSGYNREGNSSNRENSYNRENNSSNRENNSYNRENNSYNRENNSYNRENNSYNREYNSYNRENNSYNRENNRDNDNYNSYNQRNRFGTSRAYKSDRNNEENEQYANSYHNYREDRQDSRRPVVSEKLQLIPASPSKQKNKQTDKNEGTALTQRERLSDQLDRGVLECLVCCERVKQVDTVWSCGNCYHVLHLRCIRKWATSSLNDGKWRCPACQNTSEKVPSEYRCFCGAVRCPEWVRGTPGAHSCGDSCKRARACVHPCVLLCHPGPCPPCQATLNKKCGCGVESRLVVCSSKVAQTCSRTCSRTLSCGVHKCTQPCHEEDCPLCTETIQQVCYCPAKKERTVVCSAETSGCSEWACGEPCARVLACGQHVCRDTCHAPPCEPCALLPENVQTCPCGKMKLTEKDARTKCTDPIPLCGNICAKPLSCGPFNDKHFCKLECHDGPCPPCPDKTVLSCRCGFTSREVSCVDLPQMLDNVFCTKKCNKKLSCGRHRCRSQCCALETHRCAQTCGRGLACGLHRCAQLCHTGHCPPCTTMSFTELRCSCGASVTYPPVACGSRPPPCENACPRARPCGHAPHHACHTDACPPCVVLTTKRCHGGHEERKTIPCHQEEFSCGLPCGKPLPCGKHVCVKVCHKGECATAKCVQACAEKRAGCGHACGAPCHAGRESPCPSPAPCRQVVRATCPCKRRAQDKPCAENARDFAKMMTTLMAGKLQDGSSVDLSDMTRPGRNLLTLECDNECRVEARTRQMALVLQIRNPDVSSKFAPRYTDFSRQAAQRDPAFAGHVHAQLTQLVQLAKKSKQKTRSHSFPSMNRAKRQFVHELCQQFGCESVAYDAEPNRNVVATANRETSWLPSMSILEVLEREAGKRRVPGPVLRSTNSASTSSVAPALSNKSGWATLTSARSSTNPWGQRTAPTDTTPAASAPATKPPIDYFDNPPTD